MSDPALSPAQLDLLEDALEDLELEGIPSALLDPHDDEARALADTLEVYRSILTMSRQALPTEDVPPGLLADVLAEARRVAAVPAKAARAVPWYRRLGGWGPALAFAGTAALLVVIVRPTGERAEAPAIARTDTDARTNDGALATKAEAQASDAPAAVPAGEPEPAAAPEEEAAEGDLDGLKLAEAEDKRATRDAWDELGGEGSEGRGAGADAARREKVVATEAPGRGVASGAPSTDNKKGKSAEVYDPKPASKPVAGPSKAPPPPPKATGSSTSSSAGVGGVPAEPAAPVTKADDAQETKAKKEATDGWADITKGDASRRAGACGTAKTAYKHAVEDDSAEIRARAFAGLGLCELQAGNTSAAEALFAKARSADPKVGKLIESERARHEGQDQAQADQAAPP